MTASPPPASAPASARSALRTLLARGLPPHHPAILTLLSLSHPPPANPHTGFPPALAPATAHLAGAPARAFHRENARTVLATRLALEPPHDPPPPPPPPISALTAAAALPKRKAAARHVAAHIVFRARAQVDLYRRLLRAAPVSAELHVAAKGSPVRVGWATGPVVVRARQGEEDGEDEGASAPKVLPLEMGFDVREMPRWEGEAVAREHVVGKGEDVHEDEVLNRMAMADVHQRAVRAMEEWGSTREEGLRLDPRMMQQRGDFIRSVREAEDRACGDARVPNGVVGGGKPAGVENGKAGLANGVAGDAERVDRESVGRRMAAAPIAVVTRGKNMPPLQTMLADREKRVAARIQTRQRELTTLAPLVPEPVKRRIAMEEKELKLVRLQRSIRLKVRTSMRRVLRRTGISDLSFHSKGKFKRKATAHTYGGGAILGARGNVSHRVEQEAQRKTRRLHMMNSLMNHAQNFRGATAARAALHKRLLKDLDKYFRDKSREEERKKKKEQMERLRALRNNNEDEYLELLKTTKNKRLIQLLKQTDEYLVQIGAQVERQKQAARDEDAARGVAGPGGQAGVDAADANAEDGADATREPDDELQQLKKRRNDYYTITHTISEKVYQPALLIGGTLKGYQIEGLEWLVSLYNNNLNGILADEMGLGKTIQTLSLITYLVEVKRLNGPFLIIVPLSVMSNWVREMDRWSPSLVRVVYRGDPATRKHIQAFQMSAGNYNVLLTTYEFVVKDKNVLGKIHWKYIIMDEGHRMKNADCKLALTLGAKYKSRNRLLLTGTPLQNNMTELWALLNFLLPTIFSSADTFETWFNAPFQASALGDSAELNEEENLLIISRLHQVLRPFMLRRLKTDVEAQLPDKVEIVFRCEMSVWQRVLYRQMRNKMGIASGAGQGGFRSFNNMVMQLKKVCNHPFLFYQEDELMSIPPEFLMRASGKFELLEHSLRKLKRTGHRVLMFSQMTAALNYLEYFLSMIGMKHLRLDGTTKADDRQEMLELFNAENSDYFCFLLSTRAGGLGLNLQTADTVIIFDSDWNPMMDLQAQDRAHRIGQTREVRVYRLICSGSIEVKILERANHKLQIDAQVIQAGQFNNKSSDKDRKEMLKDLLRQKEGDDITDQDVTPLTEINRQLARSDEEFDIFEEMDAEAAAERQGKPRLLIDEAELPSWVLKPENQKEQRKGVEEINLLEHGRGRRKRKEVLYDDNLTEREWTAAMEEEGDVHEAIRRKRRRLTGGQSSAAESYSADENGTMGVSERRSTAPESIPPDSEVERRDSKVEDSAAEGLDDGSRSDAQQSTCISKLEPFVDPELNREPTKRRKRGRPRKT